MSVGYEFIPRPILVLQAPEHFQADVTLNKSKKFGELSAGSYCCLKALISILKLLVLREGWAPISDHYQYFFTFKDTNVEKGGLLYWSKRSWE